MIIAFNDNDSNTQKKNFPNNDNNNDKDGFHNSSYFRDFLEYTLLI